MAASARWTERQSTNIAFIDNHFVRKRKFYYSRLAINFPTENMYSHSQSPLWPSLIFFFCSVGRWHVGWLASAYQSSDGVVYSLAFFFSSEIDFRFIHPEVKWVQWFCMYLICVIFSSTIDRSSKRARYRSVFISLLSNLELEVWNEVVLLNYCSRAMIFNDPMRLLFIPLCFTLESMSHARITNTVRSERIYFRSVCTDLIWCAACDSVYLSLLQLY